MKAVVMAGGEGSRLRPLTTNLPKPLVPISNVPIMEHIVELLKQHGCSEMVATLHYLSDEISSYFGDGADFGLPTKYFIESTPLGTAGAVKQAQEELKSGTFFIVSGDALTDCDLSAAYEFHKSKGAAATLVLYRVPNPLEYGVVICDEEGRVTRFLEKPAWSEVFSDTVNTGMYIVEPEVLDLMEEGRTYDWSKDIFPRLLRDGKPLYGYIMEGYWCDVGSLSAYREANEDILSGKVNLSVPGNQVKEGIWLHPSSIIEEGAELVAPAVVGRNAHVKSGARVGPFACLGDNTLVEEAAQIERSVIWDSSYIGAGAAINGAVICSRCIVKRDVRVMEDSVVGDRTLLDVGSIVRPRVKIWPDKTIDRGAVLTMSIVHGNKWRGSLFRDLGVAGISNIEVTPDFACRLGSAFGSCLPNKTTVVTSRDATRSSRMIKRALVSSLLSVGCNVLDLRTAPTPVSRHFMSQSNAGAAVNVRKLPGNARVTLMEMFDQSGNYISTNMQRKIETAFFREDFLRIDSDDLGIIEFAESAIDRYKKDFFDKLRLQKPARNLRVVVDYGYFGVSSLLPPMLSRLGIESIAVNAFDDPKRAPRDKDNVESHLQQLQKLTQTVDYDFGVLFLDDGERLEVVDDQGQVVPSMELSSILGTLIAASKEGAKIAMPVTASSALEQHLIKMNAQVLRTKSGTSALTTAALSESCDLAADGTGGYSFPWFHQGFDAIFTFAKLAQLLQGSGAKLSEIRKTLPQFFVAHEVVPCTWEAKGTVMRLLTEDTAGQSVDQTDGIKIFTESHWVLVLPDPVEPVFHLYSEAEDNREASEKLSHFKERIQQIQIQFA